MKFLVRIKNVLLLTLFLAGFAACGGDEEKDLTDNVNKQGAVETAVTTKHLDSVNDILVTTHTVWHNGTIVKSIENRDTIPALGNLKTTGENDEGDSKTVDVKKDYEIYITVK